MAAIASATHVDDTKMSKVIGPFPNTERGVPASIFAHPKEARVIYPSGKSVIVRSLEDPSDCFVYHGHNNPVTVAKFSPSGYWVASADETGKVRVWSWDNPEHQLKVEVPVFSGKIIDLDWDPESKRIVAVGDGKTLSAKCFMWDTGNSVGEMIGHSKRISTVSYKPSRPFRIMTGGEDAKTCFYHGPPFKIDHTNSDHTKETWCVRYSPDGTKLASVGADRRIVFYDAKEGNKTSEIIEGSPDAHTSSIINCCWSPDSAKLMTCSLDKTVKIWDTNAMTCETTFNLGSGVADMQCGVVWCQNFIVSLNLAGELNYLDQGSPNQPARVVAGHYGAVSCLNTIPGNTDFITGGDDGSVFKWEAGVAVRAEGSNANTKSTHTGKVVGVFASPSAIVSAGYDDKIRFTDPATMANVSVADLESQPTCMGSSICGTAIVCTSSQAFVVAEGSVKFQVNLSGAPQAVALSADGTKVALGIGNNIHMHNLTDSSLEPVKVLEGHRGAISCLAFSPDQAFLAAGDANREIKVWDTATLETKISGKWVFHTSTVTCISWAPSSLYLASGSLDQSVIVWNLLKPMKKMQVKFAHKGGVSGVGFSDENILVSTGNDGNCATWDVTPVAV
jgi:WD40 repeat protein